MQCAQMNPLDSTSEHKNIIALALSKRALASYAVELASTLVIWGVISKIPLIATTFLEQETKGIGKSKDHMAIR